jgi:hypothetical protein
MSNPKYPHAPWRNQDPPLLQLIGSPGLPISRILIGDTQHRFFDLRSDTVLETRLPSASLPQPLKTLLLIGLLNNLEMLSGNTVDLTGLRNVLKILS